MNDNLFYLDLINDINICGNQLLSDFLTLTGTVSKVQYGLKLYLHSQH